jgi:hypothetical protein
MEPVVEVRVMVHATIMAGGRRSAAFVLLRACVDCAPEALAYDLDLDDMSEPL